MILQTRLFLSVSSEKVTLQHKFLCLPLAWKMLALAHLDICPLCEAISMFFIFMSVPDCPYLHDSNTSTATHVVKWNKDLRRARHHESNPTLCPALLLCLSVVSWKLSILLEPWSKHSVKNKPSGRFIIAPSCCFEEGGCCSCCSHSSCLQHE